MEPYPNMNNHVNCSGEYNIGEGIPDWEDNFEQSDEKIQNELPGLQNELPGLPPLSEHVKNNNNNISFDQTNKQLVLNNDKRLLGYQQNYGPGNILQTSNRNWNEPPSISINQSNSTLNASGGGTINYFGPPKTSNEFSSCNRNMNKNIPIYNDTNVIDSQINKGGTDIEEFVSHVHKYILTNI